MRAGWKTLIVVAAVLVVCAAAALLLVRRGREAAPALRVERLGVFTYGGYRYIRERLWYDNCSRCFVILEVPEGAGELRLAYVVHGGGFVAGRATGFSNMARFFMGHGYAVASVEYRLCTDNEWLTVIGDIARGVKAAHAYLEERGYRIVQSVYVGSSAGAIAGAVLIYDPPTEAHDISGLVDGFIGLSGGYCVSALPSRKREGGRFCGTSLSSIMPFDGPAGPPPRKVPALLVNGNRDTLLDRDAGSGNYNSQAACMERYLEEHGVPVRVVIVEGDHSSPMKKIIEEGSAAYRAAEEFIESLGGG